MSTPTIASSTPSPELSERFFVKALMLKSLRRFLLLISFYYPLLLRFSFSENVLNLANFTSQYAVNIRECCRASLTQILPICNIVLRSAFFSVNLVKVEKSLIIKNKKTFFNTSRGKNFFDFFCHSMQICNLRGTLRVQHTRNGIRSDEISFAGFLTLLRENLATDKK